MFPFLFYCYCDVLYLHSFPTRRSSDLIAFVIVIVLDETQFRHVARTGVITENGVENRRGGGDRKSTRLNSSHANNSYAVFCLKKKTSYIQFLTGTEFILHSYCLKSSTN